MANIKISGLTSATTPVAGTEVLPIVQSSSTKQLSIANLTAGLNTITAAKGGTGQTTYAVGDLLYADTTTTLAKLEDVATGNALISGGVGVAPVYGKISLTTHVSGTLPVANGGTGVTSSTGTVNVVLSNSPTLVTPALGTPSALVGTNITGTATSFNINGTVGATTENTGAFTTLSATGVTTVQAGTTALPAITTTGDTNTGIFFPAADTIGVSTDGNERFRIDSSGNVLVATTSVIQGGKLSVAGVITSQNSGAGYSANQTNATGDQFYFRTNSGANLAGYITCPTASTTSYASVSDYRLKENVTPMVGALAKVAQLKPVTYTWKADGANGQGFIAHELQEIVPDCVAGAKDAVEIYTDEDGDEQTRPKYQGIDTSFLVATLTAAIQELNAKFEEYNAAHP